MVLDSSGADCQTVNFNIGSTTTTTRQWDIFVTQVIALKSSYDLHSWDTLFIRSFIFFFKYTCGQEDLGGPPGCLQYYTGTGGSFKSLTRGDNMRMLQQTFYSICFRREENMCEIDYSVTTAGSFQLGVGMAANAGQAINVSHYLSKIWKNCLFSFLA